MDSLEWCGIPLPLLRFYPTKSLYIHVSSSPSTTSNYFYLIPFYIYMISTLSLLLVVKSKNIVSNYQFAYPVDDTWETKQIRVILSTSAYTIDILNPETGRGDIDTKAIRKHNTK